MIFSKGLQGKFHYYFLLLDLRKICHSFFVIACKILANLPEKTFLREEFQLSESREKELSFVASFMRKDGSLSKMNTDQDGHKNKDR